MHVAFGPTRLSHKREFFQLSVEQAIAVLSLHHQDGVPAAVDSSRVRPALVPLKALKPFG